MGRCRQMEDAVSVRIRLYLPGINWWRPVHFFAVYDGHGGSHVSALCRETMHALVKEELERVDCARDSDGETDKGSTASGSSAAELPKEENDDVEEKWRTAMKRSFERMDKLAMSICICGNAEFRCGCDPTETRLSGSAAVVAVLTQDHIVVANSGDSRAVLCRAGRAVTLSTDHKPHRPDERARIQAAAGRVLVNGGARVEGILAMSRAIGDKYLKPIVTSEPEVTFIRRGSKDECLILASDGLWDVVSSQLACDITRGCLREQASSSLDLNRTASAEDEGRELRPPAQSMLATTLLTRLASGRQSNDNISVIVVDLKNS